MPFVFPLKTTYSVSVDGGLAITVYETKDNHFYVQRDAADNSTRIWAGVNENRLLAYLLGKTVA